MRAADGTTLPEDIKKERRFSLSATNAFIVGMSIMVTLSFVRQVTDGSDDLTSMGTAGAALRLAVPIMLAGLGGIYAERAGVVNIGLEGMMIMGTWFGAWAGVEYGPWQGALMGAIGGALAGLVHAIATVTFAVDHIVSGVAINILAAGVVRYLSTEIFTGMPGGGAAQSPHVDGTVGKVDVPILSGGTLFGWHSPDFFGWLREQDWFLLSDVGGLFGGLTRNLSWLTIIAFALIPFTAWLLWRTAFGLRLRSAGENPVGAETLGVNVYAMKYVGVICSGALAGFGGAFLVLEQAGIYKEGQTGGRGFIGLAAMLFGNWMPGGLAMGSALFGYADALQLRSETSVHALVLFVAIGATLLALALAVRKPATGFPMIGGGIVLAALYWLVTAQHDNNGLQILLVFVAIGATAALFVVASRLRAGGVAVAAVAAAFFFVWYQTTDLVDGDIVKMTPYLTTLIVLAIATQRTRMPAADGLRWRPRQAA